MNLKSISKISPVREEQTALAVLAIILAIAALWAVGCGGGGGSYSSGSPSAPSTATTTPAATSASAASTTASTPTGAVTVNIVGTAGSGAFSPNPVQAASGATMVWKNATGEAHHLVMDDGTLIGVAPGGSLTKALTGSGGNYHCTTHPTMVGSINGASAPPAPTPDPSGSGYDY